MELRKALSPVTIINNLIVVLKLDLTNNQNNLPKCW